MSQPLEKHIVDSIVKYLRTVPGCAVRKRHGTAFGVAGDPDLYGIVGGRHFEIEVKRPGNQPTELQLRRLEEWRAAGALTGIAHSLDEARRILGV